MSMGTGLLIYFGVGAWIGFVNWVIQSNKETWVSALLDFFMVFSLYPLLIAFCLTVKALKWLTKDIKEFLDQRL